jgi:hypothetical protein
VVSGDADITFPSLKPNALFFPFLRAYVVFAQIRIYIVQLYIFNRVFKNFRVELITRAIANG